MRHVVAIAISIQTLTERKTGMAVPIDASGNVDLRRLQRELSDALVADRHYKATDAMKKRAITQAKNYDEFKDMVACATLKPVT